MEPNCIIIKNGNNNTKSIYAYLNNISNTLMDFRSTVHLKAFENNMNKLVTIVEILKRHLKNFIIINYKIGIENKSNFIECFLSIQNGNEECIKALKEIIAYNKENKRKGYPENLMEIEKETDKNDKDKDELCLDNINEFFI